MDEECDSVQAMLRNNLFDDAKAVLTRAALVYGNCNGQTAEQQEKQERMSLRGGVREGDSGENDDDEDDGGGGGGGYPIYGGSGPDLDRNRKCLLALDLVETLARYDDAATNKNYDDAVMELASAVGYDMMNFLTSQLILPSFSLYSLFCTYELQ